MGARRPVPPGVRSRGSGVGPVASRGGGALQIPRLVRRAVVADPGWALVVADAAQLEPRVLAALAGDHAFAEAAGSGDLYQALAGAFGGDRAKAKVALLSAMYGGAGGEASQLLAVLRRRFPRATPTWRRPRGRERKAGWSGPGSAGPARRRPPSGGASPRPRTSRAPMTSGPGARCGPAAGSPGTSWCRPARPTGRWCCWPPAPPARGPGPAGPDGSAAGPAGPGGTRPGVLPAR